MAYSAVSGELSWPDLSINPVTTVVAVFCLLTLGVSYAVSMALGVLARRRRGLATGVGTLLFLPVYWLMISAAAYCATVELIVRPHHWAKTEHRGIRAARRNKV
jgi:threonine/homoserine/homoserine lactone efflux protein